MTPALARTLYRNAWSLTELLTSFCPVPAPCEPCGHQWLLVEAASVESDMVQAEWIAGRRPRLWSKEIPA